ncbi:MAG: 30S ribosomal protein S4 [Candidatus Harrisonbacteria bacterium]|nr:30S ribosomal protein S4 [Candidatus Harrisonbacteria bacterium]
MFTTKEKIERALGVKLGLKAYRSATPKSAMAKRPFRPGMHGKARRKALSETGLQLMEKQKIRYTYGISETYLKNLFFRANKSKMSTSVAILQLLESRLDNVIYRLGLAASRAIARQLVSHGHITVNGRKVTIPSREMKVGDIVAIREQSKTHPLFADLPNTIKRHEAPVWLEIDKDKLQGKVTAKPKDVESPFEINIVVDYYAK